MRPVFGPSYMNLSKALNEHITPIHEYSILGSLLTQHSLVAVIKVAFIIPLFFGEGNHKTADVRPSVSQSVRPSVRPSSDLREGWMDQYEFQICHSLLCKDDARHLRFSKFSKMADWRPFSEL